MISKTVTQTQRFLRLPLEAQALYFHLIQNSDDDGVVEAFPVIRMLGASEDSLGLLVVKEYIRPLNDEMVYFIIDFHEQNTVRKDRYSPSVYKDLLEKIPKNDIGLPSGNHMATNGLPNISKDKLSKDNISQYKSVEVSKATTTEKSDFNIFDYYQQRIGLLDGFQSEQLKGYLETDKLEPELIKLAIDKSADNGKRNFGYINAILKNWIQNSITTLIQQQEEQRRYEESKVKGKTSPQTKATEPNNFPDLPF